MSSVACSDESAPPPRAPAPPRFVPQPVVVQLGTRGGATTLVSTQAGGWTHNGKPFTSGNTVTGENGARYRLTLANDQWAAEFIPPATVPLALGTSGETVDLQPQEDGSYRLDGGRLATGKVVEADNGNRYRLVRSSAGDWMAEFVAPPPQRVPLGTSGESRQVARLEDGRYSVDGAMLAPGTPVMARNGNRYVLTRIADGTWAATYVEPEPQRLTLGASGDAALLVYRRENGTYRLNGEQLLGGKVIEASNGNQYRLTKRSDGLWQAVYIASRVTVRLGSAGGTVSLTHNEDGTWQRGSSTFSSGDLITGTNGFEYRLTHGPAGWVAEVLPKTVEVQLSGPGARSIALARLEDGTYLYDGSPVTSGDTVRVSGSTYTLRLTNGRWTARFVESNFVVALGTSGNTVTLVRKADGTYEYDGRSVRSGTVVRDPGTGLRYTLIERNGDWSSRRYVPVPSEGGGGSQTTVVSENLEDALPTGFLRQSGNLREQSALFKVSQRDAASFDDGDYRGTGRVSSETFVESARSLLQDLVDVVKPRIGGTEAEEFAAQAVLAARWAAARQALSAILEPVGGQSAGDTLLRSLPTRTENIDIEDRLDDLEDLLDVLESVASFKAAFEPSGAFSAFSRAAGTAEDIFNARKHSLALAATENTRFGVIAEPSGGSSTTAEEFAKGSGTLASRSFAYSPLEATRISRIRHSTVARGTATYSGSTVAVAKSDGDLYSGTIELRASLGIERITARITGLTQAQDGSAWQYQGRSVQTIELPQISQEKLDDNAKFDFGSGGSAVISLLGGLVPQNANSRFNGQFVGATATDVFGTWAILDSSDATLLDGAYGASRQSTSRATLPNAASNGISSVFSTPRTGQIVTALLDSTAGTLEVTKRDNGNNPTSSPTNALAKATRTFNLDDLYNRSSATQTQAISGTTHTLEVRYRHTSYTRFGAWAHRTSGRRDYGLFSYSPLSQARYSDVNTFPRNVEASYAGRTVAVDAGGAVYDGDYVLDVRWDETATSIESVIWNLRAVSGGTRVTIGGRQVDSISFEHNVDFNSGSPLSFSSPRDAGIRYVSDPASKVTPGTKEHSGSFVGQPFSVDGPVAVMGTWRVAHDGADIAGEFGADLVPAP